MPDKDGKLTEEDRQKVIAWLARYPGAQDLSCPICGTKEWMIAEHLVQPITIGPQKSLQLGGIGYPQVMLISNPCGYTRFLNAVMVGIITGAPTPPTQEKKE